MGRKLKSETVKIVLERGSTFVQGRGLSVYYRYRRYLFRINQSLLFPAWRREHRKVVYANGKRYGWAEQRFGCVPIDTNRSRRRGILGVIVTFIRFHLGLFVPESMRGYYLVKIMHLKYIVTVYRGKDGLISGKICLKDTGEPVASFVFSKDLTKIYPIFGEYDVPNTVYTIIGYIADCIVYSSVAQSLNRVMEIV